MFHQQVTVIIMLLMEKKNYCKHYGCETWSLTLRKEHRVRVFEYRVLGIIFGPKRDEGTGDWRKLHYEKLNDLYSLPNFFKINLLHIIYTRCTKISYKIVPATNFTT